MTETEVQFQRKHGSNLTGLIAGFIDRGPIASVEELVANSYDADASNVWITLEDGPLVIEDDGVGMRKGEGLESFYRLGDSEKLDETQSTGGRKKIGKFGVATILLSTLCDSYELLTRRDRLETRIVEEFGEDIASKKRITGSERRIRSGDSGTTITMHGLKFERGEDFLDEMIKRFQWDLPIIPRSFNVYVNGDRIKPKAIEKGRRFDLKGEGPEMGKVTGDIYYSRSTTPTAGIHIYVNGRQVGDPEQLLRDYATKNSMIGHVTAIVNADGLEPSIEFDRGRFKKYFACYSEFESHLKLKLQEVRRFIEQETAGNSARAVSKKGDGLVSEVADQINTSQALGSNPIRIKLVSDETDSLGSYDPITGNATINRAHPQIFVGRGMNSAQYGRALLEATVDIIAEQRTIANGGSLNTYLAEQRDLWARINKISSGDFEISSSAYYEPAELGRLGIFGGNTLKEMVAVGLIKEAALDGERIRGGAYNKAVEQLRGFVSLVDLCHRKGGNVQDAIRKSKIVLDYAADTARPFAYCFTDEAVDNELYMVESMLGSHLHSFLTGVNITQGRSSTDRNREMIRSQFRGLQDLYLPTDQIGEKFEGVDEAEVKRAIEYGARTGIDIRNKDNTYDIAGVVNAFQSMRGNSEVLRDH